MGAILDSLNARLSDIQTQITAIQTDATNRVTRLNQQAAVLQKAITALTNSPATESTLQNLKDMDAL